MQDDLTSGFRGLWASSGQQGPIPTSGAVLQVVTVVEAEQLQDWTHSLPFPGLWPSSQIYIWSIYIWDSCALPQTQGEQGVQAATLP